MAKTKVSMRKLKEVLRLTYQQGLTRRQVASSCGLGVGTINDYLKAFTAAGLSWPLPENMSDSELAERLRGGETGAGRPRREFPDMDVLHQELRRKNVTLKLLWSEYRREVPEGYGYSQFCAYYNRWKSRIDPVMRQSYGPGEKMFVDWGGQTVAIHDRETGEVNEASIFVAVLGASNYTWVEAFETQRLAHWINGHVHAYEFFGGVPRLTIPDNPKTAVIKACRYEPILHRSYEEMAEHYGTVILPTRPGKPRDKAKVETAVQIAQRWIIARLRDHKFFSLVVLNDTIRRLLDDFNTQAFQKLEGSRRSQYDEQERDKLIPLPQEAYRLASWSKAKVNIDYHVTVDKHHYSVPYRYVQKEVEVRRTESTVEVYCAGQRIAAHMRSWQPGRYTTSAKHRPKSHQAHLEWTPSRLIDWAGTLGSCCGAVVEKILTEKPHPEQGYRSCLGILRLSKGFGHQRLEAACRRALHHQTCSYQSIQSILENGLETQELDEPPERIVPSHRNLRGQNYYQ
jgi:transposase